jgi:hypothetical protein
LEAIDPHSAPLFLLVGFCAPENPRSENKERKRKWLQQQRQKKMGPKKHKGKRRKKKKTHVVEEPKTHVPKTFIIKMGTTGPSVKQLKKEVRRIFEPNTATHLKVSIEPTSVFVLRSFLLGFSVFSHNN